VTTGSTTPIGQVRLLVTFGAWDNYRTESLDFDVAYIALPYNAILGYTALSKFMAATHHGTITVCCNKKDALRSVEHVYREAATMFPTDEVLLEHSCDLVRKKCNIPNFYFWASTYHAYAYHIFFPILLFPKLQF
jgi:hypothetical protein